MTYIRTLEEEQLTLTLRQIRDNGYQVPPEEDIIALTSRILDHIGSIDPELRDLLGYTTLSQWIGHQRLLTKTHLPGLLDRVLTEDMLLYRIGETDTDSVFRRSFSSLALALLLWRDRKDPFLDGITFRLLRDKLIAYCQLEADFRGHVEQKGWAHAVAHVSDAVDEAVRSPHATPEDCAMLWEGIRSMLVRAPFVFGAEEDERMAIPLLAMVETGHITLTTICNWLSRETFDRPLSPHQYIQRTNFKHLARSLYFAAHREGHPTDEVEGLLKVQELFR